MKDDQRAKLDSYKRVQACNTEYATDLATISDYAVLQAGFDSIVNKIDMAFAAQEETEGVTSDLLSEKKRTMAETVIEFASRASVKAQLTGDDILANKLDEPISYIVRAPKNEAVERANLLRNLMNDNLATLTNITAANITSIDDAISGYTDIKDRPVIDIQHKKSHGTDLMPDYFKNSDSMLNKMYKLVNSYFFRTKPEMVTEMRLAMQVITTGVHHTLVNITVLADEDNSAVEGAVAVDNSNSKSYTSDFTGLVHIDRHRSGHDTFTLTAPGRQGVTVGLDIKTGTENKLTVKLVKV